MWSGGAPGRTPAPVRLDPGRPGRTGFEEREERALQLRLGRDAHDPRPLDDAHLAVLLGHDDRHGVRVLGDPERRPVAGAVALGEASSR